MARLELWLLGLVLTILTGAGGYFYGHHEGWVARDDKYAADTLRLTKEAAEETARWKIRADVAHEAYTSEHQDNVDYRNAHPLHGSLCVAKRTSDLPGSSGQNGEHGSGGTGEGSVQPVLAGDPGSVRPGDPDIRHMLDVLAGRADEVSSRLREWQSR